MFLKKIKYVSLFTMMLFFFASCSSENTDDQIPDQQPEEEPVTAEEEENESVLSFTLNGEEKTTTIGKPFAAFFDITSGEEIKYGFGVSGAFSNDDLERWGFSTSFSSADPDFIVQGITINSEESDIDSLGISGEYEDSLVRIPEFEILFTAKHNSDLFYFFRITEINEENQTVSGVFSMDIRDVDSDEIYEIRNGIFTNAEYVFEEVTLDE